MASDDESVASGKTSIKLDSDPPGLTEKEKRLRKGDLERSFRSEVRFHEGCFSSCYYCLFGKWL